ncbi:succinylglutamate desuccinylase/aspartoacylase family protein, partial [Halobium palmae]
MRIHQLGDGTPEVAVVAAIHGDEPCGARAVERLLAEEPDVERPVKLIVVNEEPLDRGVRYVDEDLNRAFPGDPEGDTHEARLAHALTNEIRDCTVFSLHSTQSYGEPFALASEIDAVARSICPHLPVDVVVETGAFSEGRLIEHPHTIEVECGLQGSDEAAENAYWLVRAFLAATGTLPAP